MIPSMAVMCCCSRVRCWGVAGVVVADGVVVMPLGDEAS